MVGRSWSSHAYGHCLLVMTILAVAPHSTQAQTCSRVETPYGAITGNTQPGFCEYFGIPFATAERYASPQKPAPWAPATLAATAMGPTCAQMNGESPYAPGYFQDEDCLFLNVWTPKFTNLAGIPVAQRLKPVIVWVYGGSFLHGSASDKTYNMANFVDNIDDVVTVSFNYRLGNFGFLALNGLSGNGGSQGNWGLEDQRAALQWVQENIRYFGGDPSHVTFFGESAGAISVCLHLLSPLSSGLFSQVIMDSGNCDQISALEPSLVNGRVFASQVGCLDTLTNEDRLSCMRNKTVAELQLASAAIGAYSPFNVNRASDVTGWGPVVDGVNIPATPLSLLQQGRFSKVPILMGSNYDSMSLFIVSSKPLLDASASPSKVAELTQFTIHNPAIAAARVGIEPQPTASQIASAQEKITQFYNPANYASSRAAFIAMLSDAVFVCGTNIMAKMFAEQTAVYWYSFNHHPTDPKFFPQWTGAYHFADIPFVFGRPWCVRPECNSTNPATFTPAERDLSNWMRRYWTGFAISGNPNGGFAYGMGQPPLHWPRLIGDDPTMFLDLKLSIAKGYNKQACDNWKDLYFAPKKGNSSTAQNESPKGSGKGVKTEEAAVIALGCVMFVGFIIVGVLIVRQRRKQRDSLEARASQML